MKMKKLNYDCLANIKGDGNGRRCLISGMLAGISLLGGWAGWGIAIAITNDANNSGCFDQ